MKQVSLGKAAIAVSVFACATMLTFDWTEQKGLSLSVESAQARVGRPLTPVSVAGVARRQGRRAAIGAAAVGAGVVGAGVAAAGYYGATAPYYGQPHTAAPTPIMVARTTRRAMDSSASPAPWSAWMTAGCTPASKVIGKGGRKVAVLATLLPVTLPHLRLDLRHA